MVLILIRIRLFWTVCILGMVNVLFLMVLYRMLMLLLVMVWKLLLRWYCLKVSTRRMRTTPAVGTVTTKKGRKM